MAETGSTNDDLAAAARAGEPAGAVLVADHQTAGRGRLGRRWEAPPGASLLVSVLLRSTAATSSRLHGSIHAVGLAARAACADVAGFTPGLKWPNDLVADDRKLAGVLAEAVMVEGVVTAVVVGMGLNIEWPPEPTEEAVALRWLAGAPVDHDRLLNGFLEHLANRVAQWQDDPAGLVRDYRAALVTLGRDVRVVLPSGEVVGQATDVTEDGQLVVDTGHDVVTVAVGDVIHVRSV